MTARSLPIGLALALAFTGFTGCQTMLFLPVQNAKGTAQVFCGLDASGESSVVVALYVNRAVHDGRLVVTPVAPPGEDTSKLRASQRTSLYVPARTALCVRVPLPPTTFAVKSFTVSFTGKSGPEDVNGGLLECEPQPVTAWSCAWQ